MNLKRNEEGTSVAEESIYRPHGGEYGEEEGGLFVHYEAVDRGVHEGEDRISKVIEG
jgi:hypothetical protein